MLRSGNRLPYYTRMPQPTSRVAPIIRSLRGVKKSLPNIAREAGVGHSWLKMFMRGEIQNPTMKNFEKITAYASREQAKRAL